MSGVDKKCSLCNSKEGTKATCPLNPDAKNPTPSKHLNSIKMGGGSVLQNWIEKNSVVYTPEIHMLSGLPTDVWIINIGIYDLELSLYGIRLIENDRIVDDAKVVSISDKNVELELEGNTWVCKDKIFIDKLDDGRVEARVVPGFFSKIGEASKTLRRK